jgi:hypothetical protein
MGYSHTQKGPLGWVLGALTLGVGIGAYALKGHEALAAWAVAGAGLLLTSTFAWLKVAMRAIPCG